MANPAVNNIPPNTGRILDEYGSYINIANFLESICSTGYETGASSPSTNVSALTGVVNFNISADADVVNGNVKNVVVNVTGLTTGLLIAAAVQSAIQGVGGTTYAGITFAYSNNVYVTTSGAVGPGSKIRITAGTVTSGYSDLAVALKVGAANGAVDTDGKIAGLPVALSGSSVQLPVDIQGVLDTVIANLVNASAAVNTNILSSNYEQTATYTGAMQSELSFCASASGVLSIMIDGVAWAMMGGNPLTSGTGYSFDVPILLNSTYNLRYSVAATVQAKWIAGVV